MAKDKAVKRFVDDKDKTVQMRFPKDMFYNDLTVPIYKGGEICDVPESTVDRWLKRGGVLIKDEELKTAPVAPTDDGDADKGDGEKE